jgi:hypothetical protein
MAANKNTSQQRTDVPQTNTGMGSLVLSAIDQKNLASFEQRLQVVRDYTANAALGRTTGFYLFGGGGCGKSFTIIAELNRLEVPFKLFNSRMTGRGLFNSLQEFPDSVHLIEDMEQLFHDSGARGVLRSALWTQAPKNGKLSTERLVTWTTCNMEHSCIFTGSLIMTGNRPFPNLPELDALKTRIGYWQLLVSDNELIGKMRDIATRGYRSGQEAMDPAEAMEVCEFIIAESRGLNRSLDLRILMNSFQDYFQWRDCQSGCHWHDLVATRIKARPICLEEAKTHGDRAQQKEKELALAKEIKAKGLSREERLKLWEEKTGKSEQSLYRRLTQVQ